MLSQEHFIGYVTTTSNNTFANNFETNGAPYLLLATLLEGQQTHSETVNEVGVAGEVELKVESK